MISRTCPPPRRRFLPGHAFFESGESKPQSSGFTRPLEVFDYLLCATCVVVTYFVAQALVADYGPMWRELLLSDRDLLTDGVMVLCAGGALLLSVKR